MQIVAHTFRERDFVGGHPALDFTNTVTARNTPEPRDWLDSYARLLDWAERAHVLGHSALKKLHKKADKYPDEAAAALERAGKLREALYAVVTAFIRRAEIAPEHLAFVEEIWKQAQSRAVLEQSEEGIRPTLAVKRSRLDLVADAVVFQAVELLHAFPQDRLRLCPGDACGWVFVDSSKGGKRVWCDMRTCGNVAKARRHYHAQQAGEHKAPEPLNRTGRSQLR